VSVDEVETAASSDEKRRRLLEHWKRGGAAAVDTPGIGPRPAGARVPATTAQHRFWFVDQLFPGQAHNNLAYRLDIAGPLDIAAVERSLREIVGRHEVLRLHLRVDGTDIVQTFDPIVDVATPVLPVAAEAQADALAAELAGTPFDVTAAPLFRTALLRRAADRHTLILVVHHAVFDGWSSGIFVQEFVALYSAYANGREPDLPEPVQYGDVAVWQETGTDPDRRARDLAYWREQLGGTGPDPLDLPIDFPRDTSRRADGHVIRLALPAPDVAALQTLAAEESATLFMALLAVYQLALYRFTGQRDFAIGSPTANRDRAELQHVIGPFINLLVFRTDLDGDPNFRELLGRVRERVRSVFAHQDVPFQAVVEQLGGRRNGHRALSQVVLALQNFPSVEPAIEGLELRSRIVDTGVAQGELALFAYPMRSGELECLCQYDAGLFREDTVRRLLDDLAHLAGAVVRSPDIPLSRCVGRIVPSRVDRTGSLPLGLAQERFWTLHQVLADPASLNMSTTRILDGRLDRAAVRSSLESLIARHESLRTAYAAENGEPRQTVHPVRVDLAYQDLTHLDPAARDDALHAAQATAAGRPFDLSAGQPIRAVALELDGCQWALILTVHAIAADLRSMELILDQVSMAHHPAPLRPVPLQMGDFAAWQQRALVGRRRREHLDHWRSRLAAAGSLDLPAPAGSAEPGTVSREFDVAPAIVRRLRASATSAADGLLAAFAVLLSRYCHQDTVVIGIRADNRAEPGSADVVGCLANTLPLVIGVDEIGSFPDLVDVVRARMREALDHQEIPVDELAAELGWERGPGCHPLCRALFAVGPESAPDCDVVLRLVEGEDRVRVGLELRIDLVDGRVADTLVESLLQLLDGLANAPEQPLASVGTMAPVVQAELLAQCDATEIGRVDDCLHTLFEAYAAGQPDAAAIVTGDRTVTYRELSAWSNRIAHGLLDAGVRPGGLVALRLADGASAVAHMLGVLKARAAFAFLDPAWPGEYEQWVLALLDPAVVIADDHGFDDQPDTAPDVSAAPGDLAYVAFTSGTTGVPKAIPHSHRDMAQFVTWQAGALGIDATHRVGQLAAPTFDVAYCEIFGALCFGAALSIPDHAARSDPAALGRWLRRDRITVLQIIPRLFRLVWQALNLDGAVPDALATLRCLAFVGEALPRTLVASIRERMGATVRLVNIYGPTEAVAATFHVVGDPLDASPTVAIGRPIDGRQVVLVDRSGNPCPPGALGEIWIRSDYLTAGYLGDDAETEARFVMRTGPGGPARFYRTGDLGRLRPDGLIEFHGRDDDQVKLHGIRVELDAIEAAAIATAVTDCAAVVHESNGVQRLVLYAVPTGARLDLRALLRESLPRAMVPSEIIEVPAIPRTPNGKADRRALASLADDRRRRTETPAPRTATESTLASIVGEVLGLDVVGVHDDFFDLGGNSLQAAQIANRIREAFAVELALQDFFDEPSVAATAAALDAARARATDLERAEIAQSVELLSNAEVAALLAKHRAAP
jgi:amino acid adenylation domain-containing protein